METHDGRHPLFRRWFGSVEAVNETNQTVHYSIVQRRCKLLVLRCRLQLTSTAVYSLRATMKEVEYSCNCVVSLAPASTKSTTAEAAPTFTAKRGQPILRNPCDATDPFSLRRNACGQRYTKGTLASTFARVRRSFLLPSMTLPAYMQAGSMSPRLRDFNLLDGLTKMVGGCSRSSFN